MAEKLKNLSSHKMTMEYTNKPWLKEGRKRVLEKGLAASIQHIECLLNSRSGGRCALGNSGFYVEVLYAEAAKKNFILVRDEDGRWVVTLTFNRHPCMKVKEVRSLLSEIGFDEITSYSLADLLGLSKVKLALDDLALKLLRGIFPNVNVEAYYALSHAYVDKRIGHDKEYRRNMESEKPLETIIA